jgi:hypothetical protein
MLVAELRSLAERLSRMPCETAADADECVVVLNRIGELYVELFDQEEYNKLEGVAVGAQNSELAAYILNHVEYLEG